MFKLKLFYSTVKIDTVLQKKKEIDKPTVFSNI